MISSVFSSAHIVHHAGQPDPDATGATVLTENDFEASWFEITSWPGYAPTPLVELSNLAAEIGVDAIHYKHEGPRFGLGSFKALGGAYAGLLILKSQLEKKLGRSVSTEEIRNGNLREHCAQITLVSATDGNHGRSLAWGCQQFGAPCRIYLHAEVSQGREDAIRKYGAEIIRVAGDYDDSVIATKDEADANGWFVVSDTSWPGYTDPPKNVMAGYGVLTREICETLPKAPTHVFLQGGVGGMAASIAAALRQHYGASSPRVIVVEPDRAACLIESARRGQPTNFSIEEETIMAGLSCGEPSPIAWEILAGEAADFLTIPDSLVGPTVRMLANSETGDPKIEAGESAVAGLAALIAVRQDTVLSEKLALGSASRVLQIGSEGITDPEVYAQIMRGDDHG